MGYKEEIYDRAEMKFSSVSGMLGWLKGFKKPSMNSFEKAGYDLVEPLTLSESIKIEANRARSISRINDLIQEAEKINFTPIKADVQSTLQDRFTELEKLEKKREEARAQREEQQKAKEAKAKVHDELMAKQAAEKEARLEREAEEKERAKQEKYEAEEARKAEARRISEEGVARKRAQEEEMRRQKREEDLLSRINE